MIITVKGLADRSAEISHQFAVAGPLGKPLGDKSEVSYSVVGMWMVLMGAGALSTVGLVLSIVSAARDRASGIYGGVLILLFGLYVLVAAVKEKSSLDLIVNKFDDLSVSAKDEIIQLLARSNAGAFGGVLSLIEKLINILFGKQNS